MLCNINERNHKDKFSFFLYEQSYDSTCETLLKTDTYELWTQIIQSHYKLFLYHHGNWSNVDAFRNHWVMSSSYRVIMYYRGFREIWDNCTLEDRLTKRSYPYSWPQLVKKGLAWQCLTLESLLFQDSISTCTKNFESELFLNGRFFYCNTRSGEYISFNSSWIFFGIAVHFKL